MEVSSAMSGLASSMLPTGGIIDMPHDWHVLGMLLGRVELSVFLSF